MPLVTLETLLQDADHREYAVPQFNIDNIEFVQAIIRAAEEEQAPIILGIGQGAIGDGKLESLAMVAQLFASKSRLPIALHLDHGKSFEQAMQCLKLGFSSIMIDGSHFPLTENIRLSKQVADACHALGVSVEAELGTIGGVEDDLVIDEEDAHLVQVDDVKQFISEVPVEALAIAIGSAHGMYKKEPKLSYEKLAEVNQITSVPLVLHGGSGIPDDSLREAIALGIQKINFGTELRVEFMKGLHQAISEGKDIYKVLESGRQELAKLVVSKIRSCKANGKA